MSSDERRRFYICDLDHCVIDSPRCDLSTPTGIDAWERSIIESPPLPVPGAIDKLAKLLRPRLDDIVFVTARSARLASATHQWAHRHIRPAVPWIFMPAHDGGAHQKARQILELMRDYIEDGAPAILIDDDERFTCLLRPGDTFLHAPGCWR